MNFLLNNRPSQNTPTDTRDLTQIRPNGLSNRENNDLEARPLDRGDQLRLEDGTRPLINRRNEEGNRERPSREEEARDGELRHRDDKYNVIEGTNEADRLEGTDRPDAIYGKGGDDAISAAGGNDIVRAGDGDDSVSGGAGNDKIAGGTGDDALGGGAGNDKLFGGLGDDMLSGGEGRDMFLFKFTQKDGTPARVSNDDTIRDFSLEEGDVVRIAHRDHLEANFAYGDSNGDGIDDYTMVTFSLTPEAEERVSTELLPEDGELGSITFLGNILSEADLGM